MARDVYPLRVSTEERERWQAAADAAGVSLPEWIRRRLDEPERASRRDVAALERELAETREQLAHQLERLAAQVRAG